MDLNQLASTKMAKSEISMKTLTVASIFSNFDFYQRNYLNILNQPESYYTPVEDAWIDAFPFKKQDLYLGDLLQLWFSSKWDVHTSLKVLKCSKILDQSKPLYIFQLEGELFLGKNKVLAWSTQHHEVIELQLKNIWAPYVVAKTCDRPDIPYLIKKAAV
ncbi:hypothetical protein AT571_01470 [Acinetobacter baumannii]|nr:hypothetical protein [Acinetobacter baumannii]QDQ50718.1 hypothetical protein E5A71_01470 [Acinetobacter baumannii ATCC 17978]MBI1412673.1 hypothetical protein [Acinetobacter baumannii]MBI1428613.1 hypothetical protein [Acinetobacter baumannii]MCY3197339.1 hypothetical protein [Acinetobacter baumannii]